MVIFQKLQEDIRKVTQTLFSVSNLETSYII